MLNSLRDLMFAARVRLCEWTPPFWLKVLVVTFILRALAGTASADMSDGRPIVLVREHSVIKAASVTLNDIADISLRDNGYAKLVSALRQVPIADAPAPRTRTVIPGAKILSLIEGQGIERDSFGYSVPEAVAIERAGRLVAREEVLEEVRKILSSDPMFDMQVREVNWTHAQVIPVGATEFKIQRLGKPNGGKLPIRVRVDVDKTPAARFVATAVVDDWREVPVLNKPMERGMLISPEDLELVRLNLYKQPSDVASLVNDVVGRRVKSRIAAGSTVRKGLLDIPPDVPKGKQVLMIYRASGIQATASGTALDDGHIGGQISVKNDSSRRVVRATILSSEQVEVESQ